MSTASIASQSDTSRPPKKARSRTHPNKANGKLRIQVMQLGDLDGRTLASRRAHALIEAIENDLGGGDRLTEGARQLVQRAAVLGTFIESCEVQWLAGEKIELNEYLASVNAQRRVLATIGIEQRIARDITVKPLAAIIAELDRREQVAAEKGDVE